MAKSRQQRKARQRARREDPRDREAAAQQRTQEGRSGEVAQAEAALKGGPDAVEQLEEFEQTVEPAEQPPAPSRDDTRRRLSLRGRRERKQQLEPAPEPRPRRERRGERAAPPVAKRRAEPAERQRGKVASFLVSCWHELRRVQWPDRDTLVQASTVTLLFVAIAAAYLGALDFVFSRAVQAIL